MLSACHSSNHLPSLLNRVRGLCAFLRTVTHRSGGVSSIGVTMYACPICGVLKYKYPSLIRRCKKCFDLSTIKSNAVTRERLHSIWSSMKARCFNPNVKCFKHYGGKGVTVCIEWIEYFNFRTWALSHGYESHLTLERKDSSKNYCPENCTWVTWKEQLRHRSNVSEERVVRQIKMLLARGIRNCEVARTTGVSHTTVCRIKKGKIWADI